MAAATLCKFRLPLLLGFTSRRARFACFHFNAHTHGVNINAALDQCAEHRDLYGGRAVHARLLKRATTPEGIGLTKLVKMYATCGDTKDAHKLLQHSVANATTMTVAWTTLMTDSFKRGKVDEALSAFKTMPVRDSAAWNALIGGLIHNAFFSRALHAFLSMDTLPTPQTFSSVLPACSHLRYVSLGKQIHAKVITTINVDNNVFIVNVLIDMYAKCGHIGDARQLFDKMRSLTIVSWNAIVGGYASHGDLDNAISLFHSIPKKNMVSWLNVISGLSRSGHFAPALSLLRLYLSGGGGGGSGSASSGSTQLWNALISGLTASLQGDEAVKVFRDIKEAHNLKPDFVTFMSLLTACSQVCSLSYGMQVHCYIISHFNSDTPVYINNALIDMYAKCGIIASAHKVFDAMVESERNTVTWTAMIMGYAVHGQGVEALRLFHCMLSSSVVPNSVTFLGVLWGCSHAGLVEEARRCMEMMRSEFGIAPSMKHYSCMVDVFGRAGRLQDALCLINEMPVPADANVWASLLTACATHGNLQLGVIAANHLFQLEPHNSAHYVLLSNIYADACMWNQVSEIRRLMKDKGIKKVPGCSWIEVNCIVYAFYNDKLFPET